MVSINHATKLSYRFLKVKRLYFLSLVTFLSLLLFINHLQNNNFFKKDQVNFYS